MSGNKRKFLNSLAMIIAGMTIQAQAAPDTSHPDAHSAMNSHHSEQKGAIEKDFLLEPANNKTLHSAGHSSHSSHSSHQSHRSHYSSYQSSPPSGAVLPSIPQSQTEQITPTQAEPTQSNKSKKTTQ